MFARLIHACADVTMATLLATLLSCTSGCCSSRTQLISEELVFRDLRGGQDELRYDRPLFKKKDGSGMFTFEPEDPNDRNWIAIVPKGTTVTIVDVYRREWYRIDGNIYMREEYPTLDFAVDGKTYQKVDASFYALKRNKDIGFPRPVGLHIAPPNDR
jgi:hypothetical protein